MRTYVLRRLLLFVPTLLGASLLIFVLMRLVPGDIAEILVYQTGSESSAVQKRQIEQIRRELGLDRPVITQYVAWLAGAVRGDFGYSYSQRRPVNEILAERFPRSMELAAVTLILAALWSIPLGVVSAVRSNTCRSRKRRRRISSSSSGPRSRRPTTSARRSCDSRAHRCSRSCARTSCAPRAPR